MPRHYVYRHEPQQPQATLPPPPPPPSSSPPRQEPSSPSTRRKTRSSSSTFRATADPTVTPKRFRRFFTPISQRNVPMTGRNILGSLDVPHVVNLQLPTPESSQDHLSCSRGLMLPPSSPIERITANRSTADRSSGNKRKSLDSAEPVAKRRGIWEGSADDIPKLNLPPRQPFALDYQEPQLPELPESRSNGSLVASFGSPQFQDQDMPDRDIFLGGSNGSIGTDALLQPKPQPIQRLEARGLATMLLNREHGYSMLPARHQTAFPAPDFRHLTANFYSSSHDSSNVFDVQNASETVLPFSLASASRASITAVGDERGNIHYFNTAQSTDLSASRIVSSLNVHNNAIFDLSFSHDDTLIAAGSGNRTVCIYDVRSGTCTHTLKDHRDSLRQVKFQPSSSSILASSDKLGRIQIWDLRCTPNPAISILDHTHTRSGSCFSPASVTSLHWMPPNREHLLLSASDASTTIRLWDTRFLQSRKSISAAAAATPLSTTLQPPNHSSRSYGVTSLVSNTQGDRLYAVSKDSLVYAYSTEHLIRGIAPELADPRSQKPAKRKPCDATGSAPLYALRNDNLRVGSFYVKASLRTTSPSRSYPELLAVGSTRGEAILFPTDERYLSRSCLHVATPTSSSSSFASSPMPPKGSFPSSSSDRTATGFCPVYTCGTSLIRGHSDREVTTVSWTKGGELVTGGDDRSVRMWQEGEARARELRTCGEFGGVRFNCGWADVEADWDEDEW